jgi:hypothetical protein
VVFAHQEHAGNLQAEAALSQFRRIRPSARQCSNIMNGSAAKFCSNDLRGSAASFGSAPSAFALYCRRSS